MLGFKYLKATPTTHVMQYKNGKLLRQGAGRALTTESPPAAVMSLQSLNLNIRQCKTKRSTLSMRASSLIHN